ncbi:MAG: DUF1194 domain-containing protein [Hyphomicrobium sp.]
MALAAALPSAVARADESAPAVDTALVIAVDISQSVDDSRYALQMQGIASAFEDPSVVGAITGGTEGRIAVSLIGWADGVEILLPWETIASVADAAAVARRIRALPPRRGEFTCMARMLSTLPITVLSQLPVKATRIVIDVSGDGIDNCARRSESDMARDALLAIGATINGLPIIVAGENEIVGSGAYRAPSYGLNNLGPDTDQTTLDVWYQEHVIGGPGAFLMKANGYGDFGRAFRQKFVTEVSAADTSDAEPTQRKR